MTDLAGGLQLRPGAPVPHNLRSTRRAWASQIAPGRPADALPGLLASLFSLCGHSHRCASQLAIRAVEPSMFPSAEPLSMTLQRETTLEHLRRIGLDWPRLLASPASPPAVALHAANSLRCCPLIASPTSPDPWPELRQWLEHEWLRVKPATWLRAWQIFGIDWLNDWSRRCHGWLAELMCSVRRAGIELPRAHEQTLRPHDDDTKLLSLGAAIAAGDMDALRPRWQGQSACTGPWSRLHDNAPVQPWTTWALLGSRLAELVRLCLPDAPGEAGAGWLSWGALNTGTRQGLAWVEMARGLLIYQVALEDTAAVEPPTIRSCQVLAPTEWNFHPEGLVAQALARLPAQSPDLTSQVNLLMAAFDPCVPFHIDALIGHDSGMETNHA